MKLTGKCKKDFVKWLIKQTDLTFDSFVKSNKSMQYGVMVDFFDSVGIDIGISNMNIFTSIVGHKYLITIIGEDNQYQAEFFKSKYPDSRQEAREQAIIKVNDIYNER